MATKYVAAYYDDWGTPGTLDHARKDAATISKRNNNAMVYINQHYPGNPMAAVYKVGNRWVYEHRWTGRTWFFNSRTGKLEGRY